MTGRHMTNRRQHTQTDRALAEPEQFQAARPCKGQKAEAMQSSARLLRRCASDGKHGEISPVAHRRGTAEALFSRGGRAGRRGTGNDGGVHYRRSTSRAPSVRARIASSGAAWPKSVNARFTASIVEPNTCLRFSRAHVLEPAIVVSESWKCGIT